MAPADDDFLAAVYLSTRWHELSATGWPEDQIRGFLRQQFEFQSKDWARNYPAAQRDIILVDDQPAGRLYVDRRPESAELRVIDIALLPAFRHRGIGTRIFLELFAEADRRRWRVSIHVEQDNPAKNLYARLGFMPVSRQSFYILMSRDPVGAALASSP